MPFVNSTTGRDPSINDVKPVAWRHLKAKIEHAAAVTITLTSFDDEHFGKGWCARANRVDEFKDNGGISTRTVASVWEDGPFLALDALAARLGVTVEGDELAEAV